MSANTPIPLQSIVQALAEVLWLRQPATGSFCYCSSASERVWACPAQSLMEDSNRWLEAIHPEDRDRVLEAWRACAEVGVFDVEYRVIKPDGTTQWVHDRGGFCETSSEAGPQVAGMAREINWRKQLEAEVTKAYDALHSSVNGVIITDLSGTIVYANPAFLRLFGFSDLSAAVGHPYEQLFARDDMVTPGDVAGEIAHFKHWSREFVMRRKDGAEVLVEVSTSAVHDEQGTVTGSMASFVDVTERKRRERQALRQHRQLVRMTERMASTEERERRRVSGLIHDTVVQSLSLANIRLGAVGKALTDAHLDGARDQLDTARELIADGIRQSRLVMADLTPPLLYEVGLGAALKQFADRIRQLQGVAITLTEVEPGASIPESLRGVLFQAARELVMNACKHAAPSNIRIQLATSTESVRLTVRDDGCGFDPAGVDRPQQEKGQGFGLFSLRQRLSRRGGELLVNSKPGAGCEVEAVLPLPSAQD